MASNNNLPKPKDFLHRLRDNEAIICAGGYLMSFERRGYLQAGSFVPEVVLGRPDLVRLQYEEFVHAGSDVVLAFTYYTHRAKLKHIGKEDQLEKINRYALRLAKGVAVQTGTLMAGNICDTSLFVPNNFDSKEAVKAIFREQVGWAVQEGADYIVGETFGHVGEAILATEVIKETGLPAVVTLRVTNKFFVEGKLTTFDGIELGKALQMLQNAGADVVGFNCSTGPRTMLSLLTQYKHFVEVPFAALPAAYRTNEKEVIYQELTDPLTGQKVFPGNLDCVQCSRDEIAEFGRQCAQLGVKYLGICCGNNAGYTRALSESIGRIPPASRFRPDMSKYVSDLYRRLAFLQKLTATAEERAKQAKPNGIQQQNNNEGQEEVDKQATDYTEKPIDATFNVQQLNDKDANAPDGNQLDNKDANALDANQIQNTRIPDAQDATEIKQPESFANGRSRESISENIELPSSSSNTFSIRLPPPPGHGMNRSESTRRRLSASPSTDSNPASNERDNDIPPSPSRSEQQSEVRINCTSPSPSPSNNDKAVSSESDILFPSPQPENSFELTDSKRNWSHKLEPVIDPLNKSANVASLENIKKASIVADSTSTKDALIPEQNTGTLTQSQSLHKKQEQQDFVQETEDFIGSHGRTEESHTVIGKVPVTDIEDNQLEDVTIDESKILLVDVSQSLLKTDQGDEKNNEWADLYLSKSNAEDDSSVSSGNEVQLPYVSLDKEDNEENSQNWANFATSITGENERNETESNPQTQTEGNHEWADFAVDKSENTENVETLANSPSIVDKLQDKAVDTDKTTVTDSESHQEIKPGST